MLIQSSGRVADNKADQEPSSADSGKVLQNPQPPRNQETEISSEDDEGGTPLYLGSHVYGKHVQVSEERRKPLRGERAATNGLCVFHDPTRADDGRRARQSGGIHRSRAAAVLPVDTPDHPLGNTTEVSAFLADSVNQLRRGQLDPRVANAMGYLTSVLLRSLEQGSVEERLAKIEATLAGNAQEA